MDFGPNKTVTAYKPALTLESTVKLTGPKSLLVGLPYRSVRR